MQTDADHYGLRLIAMFIGCLTNVCPYNLAWQTPSWNGQAAEHCVASLSAHLEQIDELSHEPVLRRAWTCLGSDPIALRIPWLVLLCAAAAAGRRASFFKSRSHV